MYLISFRETSPKLTHLEKLNPKNICNLSIHFPSIDIDTYCWHSITLPALIIKLNRLSPHRSAGTRCKCFHRIHCNSILARMYTIAFGVALRSWHTDAIIVQTRASVHVDWPLSYCRVNDWYYRLGNSLMILLILFFNYLNWWSCFVGCNCT